MASTFAFMEHFKEIHLQLIADKLSLPLHKIKGTVNLLLEGATIPFIARYRKEATGSLDEVEISDIHHTLSRLNDLEKRRESILQSIEEQGKLIPELEKRIRSTYDLTELEDLYLPYKRKRKTRASVAREKGLEPLAILILEQKLKEVEQAAKPFLSQEVPTVEEALQGARDIIAEWVSEDEKARNRMRHIFKKTAKIRSKLVKGKDQEGAKYRDYFDFSEALAKCPSHRLLAMLRGEEEGFLRIYVQPEDEEDAKDQLEFLFVKGIGPSAQQVREAVLDSYDRLLAPSIETEFRNDAKEKADNEAISVFTLNLRQLLLAPPLGEKRVMGIDPGFRTGCKVVCLDENANLRYNGTIFPHPPQKETATARKILLDLADRFDIEAIAIGNGTAGKETTDFCRSIPFAKPIEVFMVNESGASIYSASEVARQEFPNQDLTVRGAVSIGRRLMDPLAELVKIDPKSIGVGQYQHDVNQNKLKENLDRVVESCVNTVGVNLNTASKHLLTYVSGLGPSLAQNIVDFRATNGPFSAREQLKKVPRLGDKAFEQCAGFLRIPSASRPLDATAVHPESYHIVEKMAKDLGCAVQDLITDSALRKKIDPQRYVTEKVGLPTLQDILKELEKPGLDPRGQAKTFSFAQGIETIDDLYEGMTLPGIVNNITNFGVFVDIGIKEGGFVHISQIANKFVKNPTDEVRLQQEVTVKVIGIDKERKRVQLSMKGVEGAG